MPDITVRLSEGEEAEFGKLLLDACANHILNTYGYDEDGDEHSRLSQLHTLVRKRVEEVIREEASKAAAPIVAQVLAEGMRKTNTYGEPTGDSIPLREVIAEEVKAELHKPTGNYYDKPRRTLLGKLLHEEVERALSGELSKALNGAKAELIAAVQAKGAEVLTESMRRALPL